MLKEEMHKFFAEVWRMFNFIRVEKNNNDEGWEKYCNKVEELYETHDDVLCRKLLLSITKEAEALSKIKDPGEKKVRYREIRNTFQGGWDLYESLLNKKDSLTNEDLKGYREAHKSEFAEELSTAVYESVWSGNSSGDESFMHDAQVFYDKYKNGIPEEKSMEARKDAGNIIKKHPEYIVHMFKMYEDLKKTA